MWVLIKLLACWHFFIVFILHVTHDFHPQAPFLGNFCTFLLSLYLYQYLCLVVIVANFSSGKQKFSGQPKRHLLTTGWSVFVSTKRLFAGDSVLFIRYVKRIWLLETFDLQSQNVHSILCPRASTYGALSLWSGMLN